MYDFVCNIIRFFVFVLHCIYLFCMNNTLLRYCWRLYCHYCVDLFFFFSVWLLIPNFKHVLIDSPVNEKLFCWLVSVAMNVYLNVSSWFCFIPFRLPVVVVFNFVSNMLNTNGNPKIQKKVCIYMYIYMDIPSVQVKSNVFNLCETTETAASEHHQTYPCSADHYLFHSFSSIVAQYFFMRWKIFSYVWLDSTISGVKFYEWDEEMWRYSIFIVT